MGSPGPKSQGIRVEEDGVRVEGAEEPDVQGHVKGGKAYARTAR